MKKTETVQEYLARFNHPMKAEIETLRSIILNASDKIAERVKWNAPSFYYKNYDMAAFHVRPEDYVHIVFVFHNGTMIHESDGLLEGDYKDRRMAKFYSMDDIKARQPVLEKIVKEWVKLVDN